MACTYCGTDLPDGALFCGECGRAVAPATKKVARVQVPTVRPGAVQQSDAATSWHWGESSGVQCEQCGAAMAVEDIFCGECGAVSQVAARHFSQPRDTVVIERLEPVDLAASSEESEHQVDAADADSEPRDQGAEPFDFLAEPEPEPESAPEPEPESAPEPEPEQAPESQLEPEPAPASSHSLPFAETDDVEATRIIAKTKPGERFVLQFSTGESSTVYGSGLVGRNPLPEPGEYFDQLIRVVDPSRSVSKTHLEFGQEDGIFWVLDRYSGNGTIVREPDTPAKRCLPDKRYRLVRGTRVEIGEQFFIVS